MIDLLVLVVGLLVGFFAGVIFAAKYMSYMKMIDRAGALRHHNWLNHGGIPPWKWGE